MQFRNLTPHAIRIRLDASNEASPLESDLVLEAEKMPLRIEEIVVGGCREEGIHIRTTQLGEIEGLPDPVEDAMLVVSMPVAERAYALGRRDVVSPDTGSDAIRFKLPNGNEGIYAVRALRFIDGGK
jgi:hypothetical protein